MAIPTLEPSTLKEGKAKRGGASLEFRYGGNEHPLFESRIERWLASRRLLTDSQRITHKKRESPKALSRTTFANVSYYEQAPTAPPLAQVRLAR